MIVAQKAQNADPKMPESVPGPPPTQAPSGRTLRVRLQKRFSAAEGEFHLDVGFSAEPGFSVIFGSSGAGKTTLLDCIAGLAVPDRGSVAIGSQTWFDSQSKLSLPVSKRRLGYVFQELGLFPHLTAEQNILYGLASIPPGERKDRAVSIMRTFRIDALAKRRPAELSGGERQRVALARSLVIDPSLLLLDEPLAALDATTKARILDDLRQWNQQHSIPIIYVTHSREEVFALGDRVIVLDRGRIVAQGTPHEVLNAPRRETVAHLAGVENIFDAVVDSLHEDRGTMTCSLDAGPSGLHLETPLVRAEVGSRLQVGIRAGDILLAVSKPTGLSARNILPGRLKAIEQRDVIVAARVDCGVEMEVHLTLAARDALELTVDKSVWLVIKTHSCQLMQGEKVGLL